MAPHLNKHALSAEAILRITASAKAAGGSSDAAYSSLTEVFLSEFKDAAMMDPGLSVNDFKQVATRHGMLP